MHPILYFVAMKKNVIVLLLVLIQFSLFAQNPDTSYVGADTTLASYQIGKKIGAWFPFVMLLIIVLLYIRSAYRHGSQKDGDA